MKLACAAASQQRNAHILALVLSVSIVIIAAVSVTMGPADITIGQSFAVVANKLLRLSAGSVSPAQSYIVWNIRLPRILSALVAGIVLAISGVVYQSVFRNPMADPYVLGISSGSSFAVALAMLCGMMPTWAGPWAIPLSAWVGGMGAALLIFLIAGHKGWSQNALLLTGIALNYLLTALMTLLMFLNHDQLDQVLFWTLGSFGSADWQKLGVMAICMVATVVPLLTMRRELDLLSQDDISAMSSGLSVKRWRMALLVIATAATASIVAFCGVIGFIGLMAPHLVRLLVGPSHKRVLPLSMLCGATIMLLSDTVSRTVMGTTELPVGVITAIAGAPLFILLLKGSLRRHK